LYPFSFAFVLWIFCFGLSHAAQSVWLPPQTPDLADIPPPWQRIQLNRDTAPTRYRIRQWDGVLAVEAVAERSMTLLARPVAVDLNRTPVLCWRWRVDAPLVNADLATKAGDDYAARVYVSFALPPDEIGWMLRGKLALARTIYGDAVPDAALNYVWDNRYPVGTRRPNAYTGRTRVIVAESGAANAGRWVVARHDVQRDVIAEFGSPQAAMVQLALAADTDNTGEYARAGFADFHFVARDNACVFE